MTAICRAAGRHAAADLVVGKLPFELRQVADVVDPVVEPAGKFRRDRLKGNPFLGKHREDHEQLRRCLWEVGLVHAHFGDERPAAQASLDMTVDLPRLAAGEQILADDGSQAHRIEFDRLQATGKRQRSHQFAMPGHEGRHIGVAGRGADAVGDVDREEITRRHEAVDRLEPDVVGIDEPGMGPMARGHRRLRRRPDARRLTADEAVFAVRLVPDRGDDHPRRGQSLEGGQLGKSLMGKTIADAKRKTG